MLRCEKPVPGARTANPKRSYAMLVQLRCTIRIWIRSYGLQVLYLKQMLANGSNLQLPVWQALVLRSIIMHILVPHRLH